MIYRTFDTDPANIDPDICCTDVSWVLLRWYQLFAGCRMNQRRKVRRLKPIVKLETKFWQDPSLLSIVHTPFL